MPDFQWLAAQPPIPAAGAQHLALASIKPDEEGGARGPIGKGGRRFPGGSRRPVAAPGQPHYFQSEKRRERTAAGTRKVHAGTAMELSI